MAKKKGYPEFNTYSDKELSEPEVSTYEQYFINEQSDFYNYLIDNQAFKARKTYRDYISRLRYVSRLYKLDKTITKDYLEFILSDLTRTMNERDHYNSKKGIGDIASGLHKFLEYVQSDYRKRIGDSILNEELKIENDNIIKNTEKKALIVSRMGQGVFRQKLIDYWKGCSVTECSTFPLLLASHIRPWRKSSNQQRLDVFNGLLLIPNLDKLFDRGYISFDKNGHIIMSSFLPESEFRLFGVSPTMCIKNLNNKHLPYLKYHRDNCLL